MKNRNNKHIFWLALGIVSLFVGGFSLYIGLHQSVWFDEAYSIELAQHSWGEIVALTAKDVHPPVYYWLLKAWTLVFGQSELALRSMSAVFLGLSIGVAGLLLRRLFGAKTALLALPFIVFAPFLLRYGFEIRMYALASLIGITATYVLVAAVEEKTRRGRLLLFALYALLVALGVYTLYFMALLWIAHLAWLVWLAYRERRRDVAISGIVAYAASFVLFVPWLPIFLSKAGGGSLSGVTHALGPENLFGIMTFMFLYRPSWEVSFFTVAAVVFVIAAVAYLARVAYKNTTAGERQYLALMAAYFVVPVLVLIVVTRFAPIYLERYIAHFVIGAYACVGATSALALRSGSKVTKLIVCMLMVLLITGCVSLVRYGNYNFQRVHTPSIKQVAGLLEDCKNGAIIFADDPQITVELNYYVKDCPVYFFNETLKMGGGFAMLSGSPLRVANASELPQASEILHVYYNKPKNTLPASFTRQSVTTKEKVSVAVYRAN